MSFASNFKNTYYLGIYFSYRCSSSQSSPQLYLGGVKDTFTIPNGQLKSTDFLGSIGTLVIDGHQLDLTCPDDSRNTIMGSHLLPNCYYNQCNEHSYCVEYTDTNGLCQCNTGFPPDTCNEHSGEKETISCCTLTR